MARLPSHADISNQRALECRIAAANVRIRTGAPPSVSAIQKAMGLKHRTQATRAIDNAIRAGYLRRGPVGLELMDGAQ